MAYHPEQHGALCSICPLAGKRFVPPEGPTNAGFVIIGEGPGANEEAQQKPFIGASGRELNDMLRIVGMNRAEIWITNTLLCRAEVPDGSIEGAKRFELKTYVAWLRKENRKRASFAKESKTIPDFLASPLDCCRARLQAELLRAEANAKRMGWVSGAVVMPVGNFAAEAVLGRQSIMKIRGSPVPITVGEDGVLNPKWDPRPDWAAERWPPKRT